MAVPSPSTCPSLLDLIAATFWVRVIRKHWEVLITEPKYHISLPTEPDPAWTIRAIAVVCFVAWFGMVWLPKESRAYEWLMRAFDRYGVSEVFAMYLGSCLVSFALACLWPGCVYQLVGVVEAVLPSFLHSVTRFILLGAPSTVLWYLQFPLSLLKPVPELALWSGAFATLILLLLCTILIFAWPCLLVGGAWTIVFYELLCFRFPSFFQKQIDARQAAYLHRSVERHHAAQARRLETQRLLFEALPEEDVLRDVLSSMELPRLGRAWAQLVRHLPTYDCYRCAEFYRCQVEGRQWPPRVPGTAAPLVPLFEAHYHRKRKVLLASSSYAPAAVELAGLISRYLLPLRDLRHLSRRFTLHRFLVILCGRPMLQPLLWTRLMSGVDDLIAINEPNHERYQPFVRALRTFHATPACQALTAPEAFYKAYFEAVEAEDEAIQAEEYAFEAILEALFRWKAVKEETKKRLKQD